MNAMVIDAYIEKVDLLLKKAKELNSVDDLFLRKKLTEVSGFLFSARSVLQSVKDGVVVSTEKLTELFSLIVIAEKILAD